MFDFKGLKKPDSKASPTDPREIFKRRPSGEGAANDLWQGQAEALEQWFKDQKDETLILLNTGAGKTIVGLLIAQSLVNQGIQNVVYVCSTIDLIKQTANEAAKLGLSVTCRSRGDFDNDLFSQGKAFCITTYAALFYGFRGAAKPHAVIFDDAHVAGKSIRDAFTLTINKKDHPKLYGEVVELFRPIFTDYGQRIEFQSLLKDDAPGAVLLAPPVPTFELSGTLADLINSQVDNKQLALLFPWLFLRDHLQCCAVFFGHGSIEITPPFLPTSKLNAFGKDVKRVYLSATINSKADFTRVFGHKPDKIIAPNVDAGDGERLFLFASKFAKDKVAPAVKRMSEAAKVVIAVPSRTRGEKNWPFATSSTTESFTSDLNKFRSQSKGAFILAGRFDGIDLPGSQCRAMVVDGLPAGTNLIEQYLFDKLHMDQLRSNTLSVRITQLLGRIIRGRQDFGFFLIADRAVENWLKNERNRAQLPELLRKQLFLSEVVEKQFTGPLDEVSAPGMMKQLINRDAGWVDFYSSNINEDVPVARLKENEENGKVLEAAGRNEVRFITKLWDGDLQGAASELESVISDVAVVDPMLAGWYSTWAGMAYHAAGKGDTALDLFDEARRRIGRDLPLPRKKLPEQEKAETSKTPLEEAIRQVVHTDLMKVNDRIAKLRIAANPAFSSASSHKQCEEAVRAIGAALGYVSTRPCTDYGKGPDNLWVDSHKKQMIAFELKTDKGSGSALTKDDIGQGHNHVEWLKSQYPNIDLLGLIYLTDAEKVSDKSDPSSTMYIGSPNLLQKAWEDFFTVLDRVKTKSPMEKLAEASKVGEMAEWTPPGLFKRLVGKACKQ